MNEEKYPATTNWGNLPNSIDQQDQQALTPPVPPAWVTGLAWLPFGIVVGFTITALPFLVTRMSVSLDRAAAMSATVMTPTFWGFLLNPILDVGLTRRVYCWLTALVAAGCMASGLWVFSPAHLGAATMLLRSRRFACSLSDMTVRSRARSLACSLRPPMERLYL